MWVYIKLVMLKSVVTSLCVLWTASMTVLMCCLLTFMAYLVMFSMEMTCTKVSCCWVWVCISMSLLTLLFMSLTSLVITALVSQLRASPQKGFSERFLLVHLFKVHMQLNKGSLFSSWVAVSLSGLYDVEMLSKFTNFTCNTDRR